MRTEHLKLAMVIITAAVMVLDSITTVLAIRNGAVELNPIVSSILALANPLAYTLFSIFKTVIAVVIVYKYVDPRETTDLIVWLCIIMIFVRAIAINIINSI